MNKAFTAAAGDGAAQLPIDQLTSYLGGKISRRSSKRPRLNDFSLAVFRDLLRGKDVARDTQHWRCTAMDRDQAEVNFANRLRECHKHFPSYCSDPVIQAWALAALGRVV